MEELAGITHALVLSQPWASLTVEGPRRFHSIATRPASTILRTRVAIYAAKKPDLATGGQAMELLEAAGVTKAQQAAWTTRKTFGAIIGTALVAGLVTEEEDPWFVGPYALVLAERRPLAAPVVPSGTAMPSGWIWRFA